MTLIGAMVVSFFLVPVAGFVLLVGLIVKASSTWRWRLRRRVLAARRSPIARAPAGGIVEIEGRILPSEQGIVRAPFSGRSAVWTRVTVQQQTRRGVWRTVLEKTDDARVFLVDDGSGYPARVAPAWACVVVDVQYVASSGILRDAQPHVEAFLAAHGLSSTWLGMNKRMRYKEEILAPGGAIYALGPCRREAGPPVYDGYRVVPCSQLVLQRLGNGAEPDGGEMVLSSKTKGELAMRLGRGYVAGVALIAVGAIVGSTALVVGIVLAWALP